MSHTIIQPGLVGAIYRHVETGETYEVMVVCEMKDPTTRQWIPAVGYRIRSISHHPAGILYIREKDDFLRRFTRQDRPCENHGAIGCRAKGCQV